MVSFKILVVNFLLASLIAFCLFGFAAKFASENGANVSVTQSPYLNTLNVNLTNQLSDVQSDSVNSSNAFQKEGKTATVTSIGFFFQSILSAGNTFITSTTSIGKTMLITISDVLHVSPTILSTILGILIFVMILAAWRLYRAGE